jgi:prolyl-tRNA editing enzyme YbaK/EbsC (Cys-tRNA(Pro) deacylase)
MEPALTPADLQAYIDSRQIDARLVQDIGETPTVPAAAQALGVVPDRIIKTLLFLIERPGQKESLPSPVIVISNGESLVDRRALAAHFDVGRKRVRLAPAPVVLDLLGYPAGGVPPFGHRTVLPAIMDQAVVALGDGQEGRIYAGGGDDRTMLALTVDELLRVVQPAAILAVS